MTGRTLLLPLAVVALLATTGCGSRGDDASGDSPGTAPTTAGTPDTTPGTTTDDGSAGSVPAEPELPGALDGRTFLSTGATGLSLVPGSRVALTFDTSDGETATLGAQAGCNSLGAPFWIVDGVLQADTFSMTEMACEPELMAQDDALAAFLTSRPTITLDGDRLTLTTASISLTLLDREVADPDRPLLGTTWTIDTVLTGDTASSIPLGATPTVEFDGSQVLVSTGCNQGSAVATVDDAAGTITFSELTLTEMACGDDLAAFEAHVQAVLAGTRNFEITAGRLTLVDPATRAGLGAAADPVADPADEPADD